MSAEFEVKMTRSAMYQFLMYHAYHGASGIFSLVAGLALIVYYLFGRSGGGSNQWLYLLFGVIFLAYQPWTLYMNALRQVTLNPVFKKPLVYRVSAEGIAVRQEETENQAGWDTVTKVRGTKKNLFVYTGKKNAFIWPKDQLGGQLETVEALLSQCVAGKKRGKHDF